MTFLIFEKGKLPPMFCKMRAIKMTVKISFSGIIVRVHSTKRENTFDKLYHISFVT